MSVTPRPNLPAYRNPRFWALNLTFWTVAGLLNVASEVIDRVTGGHGEASLWEPVVWELSSNYAWALVTPFLVQFALRVRISRTGIGLTVLGHGIAATASSLLHVAGMVAIRKGVYRMAGGSYSFGNVGLELLYELFKDLLTYAFILGLTYGFDYYRRYRERELQASRLETRLTEARLENLQHRIQPHFLFNTLNLISATMHEDVNRADRMITCLSDLLRRSMRSGERPEVTLQEELDLLQAYVEIMQARFEGRLSVEMDIDPAALRAAVPSFLLQPLVENSIKHGIEGRTAGGQVSVRARRDGEQLRLTVRDDGPGATRTQDDLLRGGLGLSSTSERLAYLYGSAGRLEIDDSLETGMQVTLSVPYRELTGAEALPG